MLLEKKANLDTTEKALETYVSYQEALNHSHNIAMQKTEQEKVNKEIAKVLERLETTTQRDEDAAKTIIEARRCPSLIHLSKNKTEKDIIDIRQGNMIKNDPVYQTHKFLIQARRKF